MSKRHDSEHDLERLLDADGGEYGAIYKRLARAEPPRRLDRTVLAEAARAVHGARAPRSQRWMLGLGSAAGVVLAAGIAWQVGRQIETQDAIQASHADKPAASRVISVQSISEPAPTPKAESPALSIANESESKAKTATDTAVARARRQAPAASPAPPPAAESAVAPQSVQAPPAAVEPQPFLEQSESASPQASESSTPAQALEQSDDAAQRAQSTSSEKQAAKRSTIAPSRAPAPSTSIQLRRNMQLAPQDWLAEITRLKREGHRQQAIENIRLFRRLHPDWVLSDDLRKFGE
jgi:hypothetical protein